MTDGAWLLLTYRLPAEPARRRVALWRKLKGLGAVYLQSGVCALPRTESHVRALKLIENEVETGGGSALVLETVALDDAQQAKLSDRFRADRDEQYREFLDKCDDFAREVAKEVAASHFTYAELEENEVDLKKLKVWLAKIAALDFCGAELKPEAERRLAGCEEILDAYARQVFDAHDENR